jgi:hypothetical protein
VALVQQYLRGEVLGRSAESVGARLNHLGEAEVGQLQVAVVGDQQVLRLEVAEDYALVVQVLEN